MAARAIAIAAALALAGACGQTTDSVDVPSVSTTASATSGTTAPPSGTNIVRVTDPLSDDEIAGPVITAFDTEVGADGPVDGVLQITDGCLYADVGSGGSNLLVFPFGTTWDPSTSTAIDPSGRSVSVGQAFFGTGEDHEIRNLTPWFLSDDELARATSCAIATGMTRAHVLGYVEAGTEPPWRPSTLPEPP